MRLAIVSAFLLCLGVSAAQAATSLSVTVTVNGLASGGSCAPVASFAAPVTAGAVICPISITTTPPSTFTGTLSLSGDTTDFALSSPTLPSNLIWSQTPPTGAGTFTATINATP